MNVLLDFLTLRAKTGAGEYARRIYVSLRDLLISRGFNDINLFALYDSVDGISYDDMIEGSVETENIKYLDTSTTPISQLVIVNEIDVLFIACAQYFNKQKDLANVKCRTICVIHDVVHQEVFSNKLNYYFKLLVPKYQLGVRLVSSRDYFLNTLRLLKWFVLTRNRHTFEEELDYINPVLKLLNNNKNSQIITVSEYSRNSLLYNFCIPQNRIKVLFSPERIFVNLNDIPCDEKLYHLIADGKKFYLMLSANRDTKNPHKTIQAFKHFSKLYNDAFLLVVGYGECNYTNIVNTDYLNDSDLALALKHCYALIYPTFFEGFGYPAIEAMRYGKPILASYVTSLPEVLQDAPIYFSPLFETEIFNALNKLTRDNYEFYSKKSLKQYQIIKKRQEHDLIELIDIILNE